uniref:Ig-like domain-containing protein n=1 Tax=Gallus gallus TaxID=9031 RepID=A0A8V1ABU0_CHICK
MLDCRISPYFTANTQILWPGRKVKAHGLDTWFTCTIEHAAGKYTATAFLVQGHEDREHQTPGQLHQGIAEQTRVSAVLAARTRLPRVRTALGKDVVLDCAFAADPRAAVAVRWALRKKGRHERYIATSGGRAEMFPQEPRGNASLLIRRVELSDEGTYICTVEAAALVLEQAIQLQITEKPTVTVNVNSLSLVEGEQQKLVCDVRNYYPADIHVQWLREPQSAGQLPDTVPNVLTSSHLRSSNGTYSFSRFFLLTATLRDNGHTYTCRVEHSSLQAPIRRSVTVAVREATSTTWLLLLLLLGLTGCLVASLHHLHQGYTQCYIHSNNEACSKVPRGAHPSRTQPRQCNAPCGDRGHAAPPAPTAPAAAAAEEPRGRVLHRGYRTRRCQGNIPAPHLPSPKSPKLWKETESVLRTVPFYPEKKSTSICI